jgi:hypothetical protein
LFLRDRSFARAMPASRPIMTTGSTVAWRNIFPARASYAPTCLCLPASKKLEDT